MNRYYRIRQLRGPAFLLLVGVNALLAQFGILGWGKSWPLYLILAGVCSLAERAALSSAEDEALPGPGGYAPYAPGQPPVSSSPAGSSSTAIVPASPTPGEGARQ